jgi:hypothetical protein
MIQIQQKDLAKFRKKFHKKQKQICPIFKQKAPLEKMVVDHKHRRKKDPVGKDGKGLIRGIIHSQANVLEGKISNAYIRYGLHKFIDLPSFLRNLADYLEHPPLGYKFIHPSEKAKSPKLSKRSYNKLVKLHKENLGKAPKLVDFPKSGKLTKPLKRLYDFYDLKPEFLKK